MTWLDFGGQRSKTPQSKYVVAKGPLWCCGVECSVVDLLHAGLSKVNFGVCDFINRSAVLFVTEGTQKQWPRPVWLCISDCVWLVERDEGCSLLQAGRSTVSRGPSAGVDVYIRDIIHHQRDDERFSDRTQRCGWDSTSKSHQHHACVNTMLTSLSDWHECGFDGSSSVFLHWAVSVVKCSKICRLCTQDSVMYWLSSCFVTWFICWFQRMTLQTRQTLLFPIVR